MYHFTALATLLAVLVYFYSSILVSRARGKFGVKLPAISGNPDFERVFRAHMNTLEWLPILPISRFWAESRLRRACRPQFALPARAAFP